MILDSDRCITLAGYLRIKQGPLPLKSGKLTDGSGSS